MGTRALDGNVAFYGRVQALLLDLDAAAPPGGGGITVVDFGAGRGSLAEDSVALRRLLQELRGPGRTVIGVDIDPVVVENPRVDEGRVIAEDGKIPIPDGTVDLVVSDFTWEHVDDPQRAVGELDRILRPGGWICARTPNKWGYIALGARVVPNRHHVSALRWFQPGKPAVDTFPTRYRMNTRRTLTACFPPDRFALQALTLDAEPYLYAGSSKLVEQAIWLARLLPAPLRSMWHVFARKI